MAVWYEQRAGGKVTDGPRVIEPHHPDQSDAELLAAKEAGAIDKGWTVKRTQDGFKATKVRWGDTVCIRTFWTD